MPLRRCDRRYFPASARAPLHHTLHADFIVGQSDGRRWRRRAGYDQEAFCNAGALLKESMRPAIIGFALHRIVCCCLVATDLLIAPHLASPVLRIVGAQALMLDSAHKKDILE